MSSNVKWYGRLPLRSSATFTIYERRGHPVQTSVLHLRSPDFLARTTGFQLALLPFAHRTLDLRLRLLAVLRHGFLLEGCSRIAIGTVLAAFSQTQDVRALVFRHPSEDHLPDRAKPRTTASGPCGLPMSA